MGKVIIHVQDNGVIAVTRPNLECGISIEEIARKDVPAGIPYLIMDDSYLPKDYEFYNSWEIDMTNPHGVGIGHEAWFSEKGTKI